MGYENKEEEMVIEALEGISYRNRVFAEALEDCNLRLMLATFMTEQHRHFLSLIDSVENPELKVLMLDYSTTMGVSVDEAMGELLGSR